MGQTTPKRATGERMETQRSTQFMLKKKKVKRRRSIDDLHRNFTSSPSLGAVSDRSPPNAAGSARGSAQAGPRTAGPTGHPGQRGLEVGSGMEDESYTAHGANRSRIV